MYLKPGLKVEGIKPELLLGIVIIKEVFDRFKIPLVITELTGGTHKEGSLHYKGLAADIRSKHFRPELIPVLLEEMKTFLGTNYDIIHETNPPHFHLEFDPKIK